MSFPIIKNRKKGAHQGTEQTWMAGATVETAHVHIYPLLFSCEERLPEPLLIPCAAVVVAVAVVSVEPLPGAGHLEGLGSKSRNLCLRKFGTGQDRQLRAPIERICTNGPRRSKGLVVEVVAAFLERIPEPVIALLAPGIDGDVFVWIGAAAS
jgi:hypothetical protein